MIAVALHPLCPQILTTERSDDIGIGRENDGRRDISAGRMPHAIPLDA
ncbi:hypothetical protein DFO46_1932 [Rhizobium sp. AG855]|nr:hypothetical protein DFO46_1932 [Rhizobium sp. AG855]